MNKILITLLLLISSLSYSQTFDLNSKNFKVGDIYISNPKIFFELAKKIIREESYSHMDSIVKFLLLNKNLVVEVGVHTDSRGSKSCSVVLEKIRSQSIVEYFINKGVNPKRLIAKGYSDTQLKITDKEISKLDTKIEKEKAHSTNRRTEFKIIRINK